MRKEIFVVEVEQDEEAEKTVISIDRLGKSIETVSYTHLSMRELSAALRSTDPENPVVRYDCKIKLNGDIRWIHIICRAIWSDDESPRYMGVIGLSLIHI